MKMGQIEHRHEEEEAGEEPSVVDHMDELMHLLSQAATSRDARNRLREILAEVQQEHAELQHQKDNEEPMTPRQFALMEVLVGRVTPEAEPTRKQAAELVLEKLELAMFQREELTESAEDGSE